MKKRRFNIGSDYYDIPETEISSFLKDNPHAVEVRNYSVGGSQYNIPLTEVDDFEIDMGFKKKEIGSDVSTNGAETNGNGLSKPSKDLHSAAWNKRQSEMSKRATEAELPYFDNGNDRLGDAIKRSEDAGYKFDHFTDNNDPTGDRTVTIDIENLTEALKQRLSNAKDNIEKNKVSKELRYWQQELKEGMTAAEWKKQTGEEDPILPNAPNDFESQNPIDLAEQSDELSKKVSGVLVGGGTGGAAVTSSPDMAAIEKSKKIDDYLASKKYDTKKLNKLFGDFPQEAYDMTLEDGTKPNSKEQLLAEYNANPIDAESKIENIKSQFAIQNAGFQKALAEDNSKDGHAAKQYGIKLGNYFNSLHRGVHSMEELYGNIQKQQLIIGENLDGTEREKALKRVEQNNSKFINVTQPELLDEYNKSDLKGLVDANQYAGLKTLQLFEPQKYDQAVKMLRTTVETNSEGKGYFNPMSGEFTTAVEETQPSIDQKVGQETIKKSLADIGRNNAYTDAQGKMIGIANAYETETDTATKEQLQAEYLKNKNISESVKEDFKKDDQRYPLSAQFKFDNQVKEIQQKAAMNPAENFVYHFGKGFSNTGGTVENVLTSIFGSDKQVTELERQRLGESVTEASDTYLPSTLQSEQSGVKFKFSKALRDGVNEVLNNKTLPESIKKQRVSQVLADGQDGIETITNPDAGKANNFFSKSTVYSMSGAMGDVASLIAQSAGLGVAGAGRILTTAIPMFTTSQNDFYKQAIAEGKSGSIANQYANTHAMIMALAGLINPKLDIVKRSLGINTAIGKAVSTIDEGTWNSVIKNNPTWLTKFANAAKSVGKESAKIGAVYGAGTSLASDLANKGVFNQEINGGEMLDHAVKATKHAVLDFLPILGLNAITNFKGVSLLQKAHIWEAGTHSEIEKTRIDEDIASGAITPEQGAQRKDALKTISTLIDKVPIENAKGKPLTDEQKTKYLYNLIIKEKVQKLKGDLPETKKEKLEETVIEVDKENNDILSGKKEVITTPEELKTIAQQAQNVHDDGSVSELQIPEQAYNATVKKHGKELVDAAIKAHPLESLIKTSEGVGSDIVDMKYPLEDKSKWQSFGDEKNKGELTYTTPDEFLSKAKDLEMNEADREKIDKLKQHILEGKKLDPLNVYSNDKNILGSNIDGRHRAVAAKELGIKQVPVIDYTIKVEVKDNTPAKKESVVDNQNKEVEKKIGKYTAKAKEVADKIRNADIPQWLINTNPNIKKSGVSGEAIKNAFADAVEKVGELIDKGIEVGEAIKKATDEFVEKYIKAIGAKNLKPEFESQVRRGFENHYRENVLGEKKVAEPPPPKEPVTEGTTEGAENGTELSFRGLQSISNEFGYEDVKSRDRVTDVKEQQNAKQTADEWIAKGEYQKNVGDLLTRINNKELVPTAKQRLILQQYLANETGKLRAIVDKNSPEFDKQLNEVKRIKDIALIARQEAGAALRIGEGTVSHPIEDYGDAFTAKMEANSVDVLTETQKAEVEAQVKLYEERTKAAEDKVAEMQAKMAEMEAARKLAKTPKTKSPTGNKKTADDFKAERETFKKELIAAKQEHEKWLKDQGIQQAGFSGFVLTPKMIKIIGKYIGSHVEEIGNNLAEVTKGVFEDIKDLFPGIVEKDVHDIIAGVHNPKKSSLTDLQRDLKDLNYEAKLLNELISVENAVPKNEKHRIEKNRRVKDLQKKLKDLKKETGYDDKTKLQSIKDRNVAQTLKVKEKIINKDFEPAKKSVSIFDNKELQRKFPKEYKETLDAIKEREDAKHDFDIALLRDQMAKRGKVEKVTDFLSKVSGTVKAIVTGIDDSSVAIQTYMATLVRPRVGVQALGIHAVHAFSQKKFDRWLTMLHKSDWWKIIQDSGLSVTEPISLKEIEKEEVYNNRFSGTIKVKGKEIKVIDAPLKPFERAFTSLGNASRVLAFKQIASKYMAEGNTFENNPELFKSLATMLNTETGRGKENKYVEQASKIITIGIWSPKLMSAKLNILGVSDLGSLLLSKVGTKGYYRQLHPRLRLEAAKDLAQFATTVVALSYIAAWSFGGDVDTDPLSSTFMDIRFESGKSVNLTGGFSGYIRVVCQAIMGEKSKGGVTKDQSRINTALRFFRGKTPPVTSAIINSADSKDFMGKPTTTVEEGKTVLLPISVKGITKQIERDGASSLFSQGLPTFFGFNAKDQRDYEGKGGSGSGGGATIKYPQPKTFKMKQLKTLTQ